MKAQDLKKQLLNVVGPVDFSQTPLELLQKFADAETDETLRRYFFTLQDEAKNNCPDTLSANCSRVRTLLNVTRMGDWLPLDNFKAICRAVIPA